MAIVETRAILQNIKIGSTKKKQGEKESIEFQIIRGIITRLDIEVFIYTRMHYESISRNPLAFQIYTKGFFSPLSNEPNKLVNLGDAFIGFADNGNDRFFYKFINTLVRCEAGEIKEEDNPDFLDFKKEILEILAESGNLKPKYILLTDPTVIKEVSCNDRNLEAEKDSFQNFNIVKLSTNNAGYSYICDQDTVLVAVEDYFRNNIVKRTLEEADFFED